MTYESPVGLSFTHLDNLDAVLNAGALRCDKSVRASGSLVTETADPSVKQRRRSVSVPGSDGVLADYVPFYFAPRSPMLLRVATGRVPNYSDGQNPIVFFVVDIDRVIQAGHVVTATDGHPVSPFTKFLLNRSAMESEIDWELMGLQFWNVTTDDGDRERRRQAEFLVRGEVQLSEILGLAVRNEAAATAVGLLTNRHSVSLPVRVRPSFYYEDKP